MHIEIRPGSGATEQKGTSKKTGNAYSIRTQEGWAILQSGEVRKVKLTLNREQNAYEPGVYDLDEASFAINNWGELAIGRVVLKPRQKASAARVAG